MSKSPEDMNDDELEAAENALTGEATETSETTETTETTGTADDAGTTTETTADQGQSTTATTTTETADAGTTTTTETPETTAAAQASAGAEAGKVAGVASKDGTRVLPYSALQAERRSARQASARAERAEQEAERLKQEIEDLRSGKSKDSGKLTEEEVARMEADFPAEGARMRQVFERNKELEQQVAAAKPAKGAIEDDVDNDPAIVAQEAIDQVPLLVEWQHDAAHQDKWERAIALDNVLKDSPKWKDKPAVERFSRVARLVAEEYDIEVPPEEKKPGPTSSKPSTTTASSTDPKKVAEAAERVPPNTLSDMKGGSVPDHGQVNFSKMSAPAMLGRFQGMTDEEIDRHLEKLG